MKQILFRLPIVIVSCCLAFGVAYVATRAASGEAAPTDPVATAAVSATATLDSSSTVPTEDETATAPTETPVPSTTVEPEEPTYGKAPHSLEELGDRAAAGSVFEKYGIRLQIPEGLGDFRVFYPVIVDWGVPQDAEHPGVIMTVYNPQTHSSVFLRFEDSPEGPRPIELGRNVEKPEAAAVIDEIVSAMEVAR